MASPDVQRRRRLLLFILLTYTQSEVRRQLGAAYVLLVLLVEQHLGELLLRTYRRRRLWLTIQKLLAGLQGRVGGLLGRYTHFLATAKQTAPS